MPIQYDENGNYVAGTTWEDVQKERENPTASNENAGWTDMQGPSVESWQGFGNALGSLFNDILNTPQETTPSWEPRLNEDKLPSEDGSGAANINAMRQAAADLGNAKNESDSNDESKKADDDADRPFIDVANDWLSGNGYGQTYYDIWNNAADEGNQQALRAMMTSDDMRDAFSDQIDRFGDMSDDDAWNSYLGYLQPRTVYDFISGMTYDANDENARNQRATDLRAAYGNDAETANALIGYINDHYGVTPATNDGATTNDFARSLSNLQRYGNQGTDENGVNKDAWYMANAYDAAKAGYGDLFKYGNGDVNVNMLNAWARNDPSRYGYGSGYDANDYGGTSYMNRQPADLGEDNFSSGYITGPQGFRDAIVRTLGGGIGTQSK